MGNLLRGCCGESRLSQDHRRSTRAGGHHSVVTDNLIRNMRSEHEEYGIRKQASQLRSRQSLMGRGSQVRRGSNASIMSRKSFARDRKSVIADANESLRKFSLIDIDKSSDLKKLKEREAQRKSKLDVLNRRLSISTPDLHINSDNKNAIEMLSIPVNRQRRLSLSVPGESELDENGELIEIPRLDRRVSIGGRRNSTVFNFDPRTLPNTQNANLLNQPKKSAMRRPSCSDFIME